MIHFKGFYKILSIVDGDGMVVSNLNTSELIEIRLYGIDAPEVKKCRKLLLDEKVTRKPGSFLIKLGLLSKNYLSSIAPINTTVSIYQETKNKIDMYGRTLAYAYLPDGICINEQMIKEGYAKPLNEYYCNQLGSYQYLSNFARQGKKGLYNITQEF
jgi:micrococcal nuclease